MTDFFDFDNTNAFLANISGAVNNTPPSSDSGDEHEFRNNKLWGNEIVQNDLGMMNYNLNNNVDNFGGNMFFNPAALPPVNENDIKPTAMSEGSHSHGSSFNDSPTSNPAESSTNTSPESVSANNLENSLTGSSITTLKGKSAAKVTKPGKKDKSSHNMIEKKYRTNINDKILALRDAVPSLRIAAGKADVSLADLEGLSPASKLNKASVLTKATEYIKHMEKKNEILKNQNIQLQKMLEEASLYPPANQMQLRQRQVPDMNSNFNNVNFNNQINPEALQQQAPPPVPQDDPNVLYQGSNGMNRYVLGGVATLMGTSLFTGGDHEFRGLGALPIAAFLPSSVLSPSPLILQLYKIVKLCIMLACLIRLYCPFLPKDEYKVSQKSPTFVDECVMLNWILVNSGTKVPEPISTEKKEKMIDVFNGDKKVSTFTIFKTYMLLTASESNFENSFLTILFGLMLITRRPIFKGFISGKLAVKGKLLMNFSYRGEDESLKKLSTLMHEFDNLSIFGSKSLMSRLSNLSFGDKINSGLTDGQDFLKFVEVYISSKKNIYEIIFQWRLLEITNQMNMEFLKSIVENNQDEVVKELLPKLSKLKKIVSPNTDIARFVSLFESVIDPNHHKELFSEFSSMISRRINGFKVLVDGQDLTDTELTDQSDVESEDKEDTTVQVDAQKNRASQSSLISSLNLISDEQYIILSTTAILYYFKNGQVDDAAKLLKHLQIKSDTSLSLLSFTSLLNLVNEVIPKIDETDILDGIVKIMRVWINNKNLSTFMSFELRSDISSLIVSKGKILSGISSSEED